MEAKERMVRGLDLFSECSRDEMDWVLRHSDVINVRPGEVLARRGGYAREFMVVVAGSANATIAGAGTVTLLPGSFIGSDEIENDRPHASMVEASDGLRVLVFELRAFRGFAECVPSAARKLAGVTVQRVPAHRYGRRLAVAS